MGIKKKKVVLTRVLGKKWGECNPHVYKKLPMKLFDTSLVPCISIIMSDVVYEIRHTRLQASLKITVKMIYIHKKMLNIYLFVY